MSYWLGSPSNRFTQTPSTPPLPVRRTALLWCSRERCAITMEVKRFRRWSTKRIRMPNASSRRAAKRLRPRPALPVAAIHRVGHLEIGDLALVAAVAAPHRAEAFAACAELVERIKHEVPIWKRQHFANGVSEWVGL